MSIVCVVLWILFLDVIVGGGIPLEGQEVGERRGFLGRGGISLFSWGLFRSWTEWIRAMGLLICFDWGWRWFDLWKKRALGVTWIGVCLVEE